MTKPGQPLVDLRRGGQAAGGHIMLQTAGGLFNFSERAVEVVHRQMVLRDDDCGRMRGVVDADSRAAA
jgi:hypothetical protein